jgi:CDGSH iron-sulfur domain-containing protein 3
MLGGRRLPPVDCFCTLIFDCGEQSARLTALRRKLRRMQNMARLVRHEEMGPYEIPEGTELPVWVCGCGLSKNKPYCDGSHQKCRDEIKGQVYNYTEAGRTPVPKP